VSTEFYSCTMPRSKDRKNSLLTSVVLLLHAAAVLLLTMTVTSTIPLLFWGALSLAISFVLGAALFFWVWWDVRNDG
jgi:peptidoglycan/LPS O-acetylase OafA/YrhL